MKIERKYMAHYLNAAFSEEESEYCRLGADLEEYSPELSANVEKKTNILGQTSVVIDSYQKQGEVSPYYADKDDPLFEKLQAIIDGDLVLDQLKTDMVEVKLWGDEPDSFPAVAAFTLRLVLPYGGSSARENAALLLELQRWVLAESAGGRAPVFGNTDTGRERLTAADAKLEKTGDEGTAVYAVQLKAEYTIRY